MTTLNTLRSPSGRYYVRHSSGMGTVMHTNILGEWKKILILDRKYWKYYFYNDDDLRKLLYFIQRKDDKTIFSKKYIHGLNNGDSLFSIVYDIVFNFYRGSPIFLSNTLIDTSVYWMYLADRIKRFQLSDDYLNRTYSFLSSNSSRQNCDNWIKIIREHVSLEELQNKIVENCPVPYCRSIKVDGIPCDLPNIHILMRLYVDRFYIDAMDDSVCCGEVKNHLEQKDKGLNFWSHNKLNPMVDMRDPWILLSKYKSKNNGFVTGNDILYSISSTPVIKEEKKTISSLMTYGIYPSQFYLRSVYPAVNSNPSIVIPVLEI